MGLSVVQERTASRAATTSSRFDIPDASNASDLATLSSWSNTARAAAADSSGSPSETPSCSTSRGVDAVSSSVLPWLDVELPHLV